MPIKDIAKLICTGCKIEKPIEDFSKDTRTKSGFRFRCKTCCKQYQNSPEVKKRRAETERLRRKRNPTKFKKYDRVYRNSPKMIEWKKNYEKTEKRIAYNKSEKRIEAGKKFRKEYYKTEKGKLARRKKFQKREATKNQVISIEYSTTDLMAHFKKFGNNCFYCDKDDKQTLDHFVPYSKNGPNCLANLVPACPTCNSSKHNKHGLLWFRQKEFYSLEKEQKLIKILSNCVDEIKENYPEAAEIISKGLNL